MSPPPGAHVDRHEASILFKRIVYRVEQHWSRAGRRIRWQLSPAHDVGGASIPYGIGVWPLPGAQSRSDPGELLRTLGFSAAPCVFAVLGALPGANPWVFLAVGGWLLTAIVIAVRQALDYCPTLRAIAVCAIRFPLSALLLALALLFTGPRPF